MLTLTEMTLAKVLLDILNAVNSHQVILLSVLDMDAAFHMVTVTRLFNLVEVLSDEKVMAADSKDEIHRACFVFMLSKMECWRLFH